MVCIDTAIDRSVAMGNVHAGRKAGLHGVGTVLPSDRAVRPTGQAHAGALPVLAASGILPAAVISGCPETASLITERD